MSFYAAFAEHYESVFPFREEVYRFLQSVSSDDAERILDIGCGSGHYCGRWAADAVAMIGIDLDRAMIAAAQQSYPQATFRILDMTALARLDGHFDTAFCIGNVLAHLAQEALPAFLDGLHHRLRPGAIWILQTVNWDRWRGAGRVDFPDRSVSAKDLTLRRSYEEMTAERVRFRIALARNEELLFEGETWLHPLYAEDSIAVHAERGFRLRHRFGDFDRAAYDPEASPAHVAVFERLP